ncbi:MAG: AgmX/PglI C-terminal domain-containing protein [Candidatus Binatia bacterium]
MTWLTIGKKFQWLVLCCFALVCIEGCGRSPDKSSSADALSESLLVESSQSAATPRGPTNPFPSTVALGRNLGLEVTGKGVGEETRSAVEIEHQLLSFVPQLQATYEQQLVGEPDLLGSLVVKMTIEPAGMVSDLRFPVKRVSNEKLTSAMYDIIRAWRFFPAEHAVDVRYRIVFIPAGVDLASIIHWESTLADRSETEGGEPPLLAPIASTATPVEKEANPVLPVTTEVPEGTRMPADRDTSVRSERDHDEEITPSVYAKPAVSPPDEKAGTPATPVAQWYRVVRVSKLYAEPRMAAPVVTRLAPGKRVRVMGVIAGEWLEVQSVRGRRPGFLHRDDAHLEPNVRARR